MNEMDPNDRQSPQASHAGVRDAHPNLQGLVNAISGTNMKAENEVIVSVLVFFIGFAVGGVLDGKSFDTVYTVILPAVTTLLAAYLGAKYAFKLQAMKNIEELASSNVAAGNRAVFSLIRTFNRLKNIETQFIEPYKHDKAAFLQMPPVLGLIRDDISLDFDSISFLLETKHRNLLGEITVGFAKYQSAIDAINERSKLHINQVQPLLEKADFIEGQNYSFEHIEAALGKRLYITIKQSTDQVFEHTTDTLRFIEEVSGKLTKALQETFPGREIISLGKI